MSEAQVPEHTVSYTTRDGEDVAVVEVLRTYPGEVTDVWDALTNAERLPRWFLPVSGELRLGGRYQLEGNAGGTVTSCDPPHAFASTWELGDFTSWLAVELIPDGEDRTTVRLAHTVATDNDHWRQFGPAAVGIGWDLGFYGLGLHLRTGADLDPEAEQMWSMSREGVDYITACAEAWRAADTAAGADEGESRARADACVRFYTTLPEEAGAGDPTAGAPA
ncbi:SRPBCC family protein [Pseudactinotalea suaedae]|uniref:SRPBCC family protein n=1 Tax=Pseudactinotalea suaedae TaxID=1524924 RepID=UPI0012E18B40|nr:SRPBCC family protein [Pseudactinotalea suaedae]